MALSFSWPAPLQGRSWDKTVPGKDGQRHCTATPPPLELVGGSDFSLGLPVPHCAPLGPWGEGWKQGQAGLE